MRAAFSGSTAMSTGCVQPPVAGRVESRVQAVIDIRRRGERSCIAAGGGRARRARSGRRWVTSTDVVYESIFA